MKLKINPKTLDRMDYQIAIPSYRRSDQIVEKTLKTLAESAVPRDKITIFIVADEEALYKNTCPDYKIVIGAKGLPQQRNFIQEYYPLDTYIVMLDDDLTQIYKSTSDKTKEVITNLPVLFDIMIQKMIEEDCSLCGIYPVDNIFFSFNNQEVTSSLKYIVGAFFIIKNTRLLFQSEEFDYGSHEDKIRTIKYYQRDKKVLRYNHICLKTKYFGKGGLYAEDRLSKHSLQSEALYTKYPSYLRLVKKKNITDLAFKKISS